MEDDKAKKKIIFCLIFIAIAIVGLIVSVGVMIAKLGVVPMIIYLLVWIIIICLCIIGGES